MNKLFNIGQFLYFYELLYNGGDKQITFIKKIKYIVIFFYFRRSPG